MRCTGYAIWYLSSHDTNDYNIENIISFLQTTETEAGAANTTVSTGHINPEFAFSPTDPMGPPMYGEHQLYPYPPSMAGPGGGTNVAGGFAPPPYEPKVEPPSYNEVISGNSPPGILNDNRVSPEPRIDANTNAG